MSRSSFELQPHQSPFARDEAGQLADIEHVGNGKRCNCTCLTCGQPLIAKQGEVNAWHFAHAIQNHGDQCAGGLESALHIAAKEILERERLLTTPRTLLELRANSSGGQPICVSKEIPSKQIKLDNVVLEKVIHEVRPDVLASVGGRQLIVEITVSHGLDLLKRKKLQELGIAAMEINLKTLKSITIDGLRELLVSSHEFKRWVVNSTIDKAMVQLERELQATLEEHENTYPRQPEIEVALKASKEPWKQSMEARPPAVKGTLTYTLKDGTEVVLMTRPVSGQCKILNLPFDSKLALGMKGRFPVEWAPNGEVIFPSELMSELIQWLSTRASGVRN